MKRPTREELLAAIALDDLEGAPDRAAQRVLDNATERSAWAAEDLATPAARDAVRALAKLAATIRVTRRQLGMSLRTTGDCVLMAMEFVGYGPSFIDEFTNRLLRTGGREPPEAIAHISRELQ